MSDASTPYPEPAIQVAARLLAEGEPAQAVERLAVLVGEAPTYAAAHVLHATALEAAGRIDDALDAWSQAAALVPRSPLVHRERERLLASQREPLEEAAADLPPAVPLGEEPVIGDEPADVEAADREVGDGEDDSMPFIPDAHDALPVLEAFPLDAFVGQDDGATEEPDAPDTESADESQPEPPAAEYGASTPLDVSDLLFGDPFTPAPSEPEPATYPLPEQDVLSEEDVAEDAGDGTAEVSDTEADSDDWSRVPPSTSELLPPEEPSSVEEPDLYVPESIDFEGWEMLVEEDVPTPPPDAHAEPDVIAPEGDDEDYAVADELDSLIAQLEDAPRIRPDPGFSGPEVSFDDADVDEMASETLAKIYAAQHQYVEAALIYEKLAARRPEEADELLRRAAEMRERG